MKPLDKDALGELRQARQRIGYGYDLTQQELNRLASEWSPRVEPDRKDASEQFAVSRPNGATTGVAGPRWLFHLLGLSHRAAHVGLATPSGQVILQRRAPTK